MKRASLAIGTLVLGLALGACSSSDSTPAATGDGGAASGGEGFNPATSGMKCATGGTASMSKCTKAEDEAYGKCIVGKCDGSYKKCLGDGYQKGTYAGECGSYLTCINTCACGDGACLMGCTLPMTCTSCFTELASCATNSGCKQCAAATPAGGMTGGTTAGAGCAALMACCASQTGQDKTDCTKGYDMVKAGGDMACGVFVMTYRAAGKCK